MIVDLTLLSNSGAEQAIVENVSFISFAEKTLSNACHCNSKENAFAWRKDLLWLLGILYASSNVAVVSNIDKFLPHIINQVSSEQQFPDFAVISEGLICIYNLFSNFENLYSFFL